MILLSDLGAEPKSLQTARARELPKVRSIVASGTAVKSSNITGYDVAKLVLAKRQHHKCCYCEQVLETSFRDVEHFRPKVRYWWLAWTWENLIFSCEICNRSSKNDLFPMFPGSTLLAAEAAPPGGELPLLLHPRFEDPLDHIQLRQVEIAKQKKWLPFARNKSKRGEETIQVCKLKRPELVDFYTQHVEAHVLPFVEDLQQLLATLDPNNSADQGTAKSGWSKRILPLLEPTRKFLGLTYDALDHFFPAATRTNWGFDLPRPVIKKP